MEINEMPKKLALEVEDDNILIIQDSEDTKQISIAEFVKYLFSTDDAKELVNTAISNLATSMLTAQYVIAEDAQYHLLAWIEGTNLGYIQIALQDFDSGDWLTSEQILALESESKSTFNIKVMIDSVYQDATSFTVNDFADWSGSYTNEDLTAFSAGYISVYFDTLTNNQLSAIQYGDISISLASTEELNYIFVPVGDTFFDNQVVYVEEA